MKQKILSCIWTMLLCLSVSPAVWSEQPLLMHIDEIQPGMKGIGKTVFSGTTVEEFDVEIVGVLKARTPHGDAIMAKVSGGPLPLEKSGVLAGMSGSPIYIDGKLIGALAFIPAPFPKEPMIAGITPIHEMLRDAERLPLEGTQTQNTLAFSYHTTDHKAAFHLVPIQTPFVVAGADHRVLAFMEEQLSPFQITAIQGGNASQAMIQDADPDLKPGSAIAIQLVRGDMDMSAVGTVTYREGNTVFAFGHPMFFAGEVSFPMSAAYVNLTVFNMANSFKLATSLETVGSITQDRRTGIFGIIGQTPRMVPLDVTVQYNEAPSQTRQYTFEVIDNLLLTSLLMKVASFNALLATEKMSGDVTIQTRTTITFQDSSPLIVEDQFTGKQNPIPAILEAFAPLDAFMNNRFEPIAVEHVSLEITLQNTVQFAEIVGIRVRDNLVRPGEDIDVTITLRPYGKEELIPVSETITIPEDAQQGSLQLLVCDANVTSAIEAARAQAKFQPQSLSHLKQLWQEKVSQNTIVISVLQPKLGAVVQGRELPSPPTSMMTLMSTTGRSAGKNSLTRGQIVTRKYIPTPYVIAGCTVLELQIDHHLTDRDSYSDEQVQPRPREVVGQ